ncbi:TIGR04282 family arsenosugar biosynthesis glycosyltransferase [Eionea flava]
MSYSLLVMSKSPERGRVKTRMQPFLTQTQSCQLHIQLTQQALQQWIDIDSLKVELWVGGNIAHFKQQILLPLYQNNVRYQSLPIYAQAQGDLGQRMHFATEHALRAGATGVVVVGTDCPFISPEYIKKAIQALKQSDVVIGPASDGGYVLIGIKQSQPALFSGVKWGSASVLETTQAMIQNEQLSVSLLPVLSDIDTPEDLQLLKGELHGIYATVMNETAKE